MDDEQYVDPKLLAQLRASGFSDEAIRQAMKNLLADGRVVEVNGYLCTARQAEQIDA